MPARVTSLNDPISLDTPGGKAAFYVCHVLPEWLATLTLFGSNIRKGFGTGLCGDYRYKDETESEKIKRHARKEKRKQKKEVNVGLEMNEKK